MRYSDSMKMITDEFLYFSDDLPAARQFYTDVLGCELEADEDWGFMFFRLQDGGHIGVMHPRNWASWEEGQPLPPPVLCLRVDSLAEVMSVLKQRGASLGQPDGPPGVSRGCRLSDPAGNIIYLFEDPSEQI